MDYDQSSEQASTAPAKQEATSEAPVVSQPKAPAPAETAAQAANPLLAPIAAPITKSFSREHEQDDGEGDVEKTKTEAKGSVDVAAKKAEGEASRTTSSETKDAVTGGSTKAETAVKGTAEIEQDGGKGSASVEHSDSQDSGDGTKNSSSTKLSGGVEVKDGKSSADASVSSERAASIKDDDSGVTSTRSDKVDVDAHLGEDDSHVAAGYDRSRSTDDGAAKTSSTTHVGGRVDDKGVTIDAARSSSSSTSDGHGASESSSGETKASVGLDKQGDLSVDASGKTTKDWSYADDKSPLATNRGASADGSIHVDKDKMSAQGDVEAHRGSTDEEGNATAQSGKLGGGVTTNDKGETTWNASASAKSSDSYADKDAKVAGSTDKSASASVSSGPDKTEVKGDISASKKLSDDDTGSAENTAKVGGGVTVAKDGTTTVTGTGGVESKQSMKTADGTASDSTRKDVSFSSSSDGSFKAGAGVTKTHEETHADGTTSSRAVDGGVEVSAGPGKEGIAGHVGFDQNGNRVAVAGGYNQTFGKPTQAADGTWTVPYSSTAAAAVEGGAGKDAKVGGSVSGSSSTFGSRTFASEAEAQEFYAKGEVPSTDVPKTAADAKNLPAGTTIGTSTSGGIGGNAGASGGGVGVNAGAEVHGGSSIAVTAKGNGVVEVTSGSSDGKSGTVGMSGGVASASAGASKDHDQSRKVQFDLNTPEGQAAYDQYLKDPSKVPDSGATVTQKTEHDREGTSWNAGAGVQIGENDTYDRTVVRDKDGNVVDVDQKGTTRSSVAVPLLGHASESTSLDVDTKDGKTTYTARKDIDDSMASDANRALAKATNTDADVNVSGKTQGKWSVDTTYSDAQMEQFAKKVESGEYNKSAGTVGDAAREDLRQALAQAGDDPDKRKEALAKFTENGGDDALKQIKAATGQDGEHYVALDGDKYLTGAKGRAELDQQIAAYEKQVNGGAEDPSTVGDLRALLAAQKERQREVGNPANYPELPSGVRAQETARSQADIERLEGLLGTAKDDRAAFGDPPATSDADDAARDKLQASSDAMAAARADEDKAYAAARLQHKIQDGYYSQSTSTPREQFGDKTLGVFDNSETQSYAQADKAYADAQAALKEANRQEGVVDRTGDDTAGDADASSAAAARAAEAHRLAAAKFEEANRAYQAIAARHKNDAEPGSFDGQNHQLKPGE